MPDTIIKNKTSILRHHLIRIARNECEPPARIEDIINWSNKELQIYITRYKIDAPVLVQEKLIDTSPVHILGSYTEQLRREINNASSQLELAGIWNNNLKLHGNPQFQKDFFKKSKEFKK